MKKTKSLICLILCSFIWGTTFIAQDTGMDNIGPFTFNAVRFFVGFLAVAPFVFLFEKKKINNQIKDDTNQFFKLIMPVGIFLFLGCIFQQVSLLYTDVANSAFFTIFYVPLVPIIVYFFFSEKLHWSIWPSALACIVGAPACKKNRRLAISLNYKSIKSLIKYSSLEQKIIFPTTNSGYGIGSGEEYCTEISPLNPISLYGKTKVDAEKIILDAGNALSLRLATVFGVSPRMRMDLIVNDFVYKAFSDGYLVLFEEHFKRNFIHIHDVSRTFDFCIDNFDKMLNESFNVGLSSANITKRELAGLIKNHIPD